MSVSSSSALPLAPLFRKAPFTELARRVSRREYEELVDYALRIGITRGFMQEGPTAEESFIPVWDGEGVVR